MKNKMNKLVKQLSVLAVLVFGFLNQAAAANYIVYVTLYPMGAGKVYCISDSDANLDAGEEGDISYYIYYDDKSSTGQNHGSKPGKSIMILYYVMPNTGNVFYGFLDDDHHYIAPTYANYYNVNGYSETFTVGNSDLYYNRYAVFSRPISGITASGVTFDAGTSSSVSYTLTASTGSGDFYNNVVAKSSNPAVFTVTSVTPNQGTNKQNGTVAIQGVSAGTATLTLTAYKPDGVTVLATKTVNITVEISTSLELGTMSPTTTLDNNGIGQVKVTGSGFPESATISIPSSTHSGKFQVSTTGIDGWGNSVSFPANTFSASEPTDKTVYVRINPNVVGATSIFSATLKADAGTLSATTEIKGKVTPTLTVPTTPISWQGLAAKSFSISGTRLSGSSVTVSATPTSDFEISQNKDSWSSSVQVSGTNVNSGVTLYVRMKNSLTPGSHSGSISVATSDVDGSKSFDLDGTLSKIWQENITEEPYPYQAASINTPEAFAWCLKQNDNGTLTQDVDLSKFIWNPVSNFSGTLNGNGHKITGLTNIKKSTVITEPSTVVTEPGMFANIKTGGMVKNIIIEGYELMNEGVGNYGIIANEVNGGTVSGCVVNGGTTTGNFTAVVGQLKSGTVHSCVSQVALPMVHTITGGTFGNCLANKGTLTNNTAKGRESQGLNSIYKDGLDWKYVTSDGTIASISFEGTNYTEKGCKYGDSRLVDVMNEYAKLPQNDGYALWAQPIVDDIHEGIPVLKAEGSNTVVGQQVLAYGNLSDLLSSETPILFYGKGTLGTAYSGENLYIDEDAALKVSANVKAHTSRFIANLPSKEIWHHYSSPVNQAPTGIDYNKEDIMLPGVSCEPVLSNDLFPSGTYIDEDHNNIEDNNNENWDLYSYYEPAYHWLNFKRNALSHYQNGDVPERILLEGDLLHQDYLRNGEGYLIAMAESSYIQSTRNLNHGNITRPVTVSNLSGTVGDGLQGLNLLGNPYQCYLSFKAFAEGNAGLWKSTTATYLVYDPKTDKYSQGTMETTSTGSAAASGDISMHQGFFIVAQNAGNATFTDAMCSVNPDDVNVHFRDGEKFAYPLINLVARDAEGLGDVAVVEFDRPEFAAAPKIFNYGGKGKVFFRHEDEDDALLFLDEETDQLPVRFAALEDGDYTIEWSTANADFSYLHLIDNMTGNDIDMLARDSYSFAAKTTDYTSRFRLVFSYTGVGEENVTEPARTFAFVHDGNLVVNGQGHMQVIDLNGRTVVTKQLTGEQNTVSLPNVAPGVYVIRLTNEKESNVQKIIIK